MSEPGIVLRDTNVLAGLSVLAWLLLRLGDWLWDYEPNDLGTVD